MGVTMVSGGPALPINKLVFVIDPLLQAGGIREACSHTEAVLCWRFGSHAVRGCGNREDWTIQDGREQFFLLFMYRLGASGGS
jgi:hypothetical protein